MAACINCVAPLMHNSKSEFCSRSCESDYWIMDGVSAKEKVKEMAQKTEVLVTLVDDLTGDEFQEGEGETFNFAFDGEKYELDLNAKNAKAFRTAVGKYVKAARVVTGRRSTGPSEAAQVREWAKGAGVEVNAKGRIPESVLEQYRAAQK